VFLSGRIEIPPDKEEEQFVFFWGRIEIPPDKGHSTRGTVDETNSLNYAEVFCPLFCIYN